MKSSVYCLKGRLVSFSVKLSLALPLSDRNVPILATEARRRGATDLQHSPLVVIWKPKVPLNMTNLLKYFASHRTVKCLIYAECRLFFKELLSIPTQSGKTLSHEMLASITFQFRQYTCNPGCVEVTFFYSKASKNELVQEIQCLCFFFQYFLSFGTIGPFIRGKMRRELYHLYEHVLSNKTRLR